MKTILKLFLLLYGFSNLKAQITYSITIPDSIPEYDGTYENFGQNHFFYPNDGEIRYANEDQTSAVDMGEMDPDRPTVDYYTKFTYPAEYLLNNTNMSFLFYRRDTLSGGVLTDSLHRIDLKMDNGNSSALLARVDTQNTCVLNYFTQWFSSSGRTNVEGGASIAVQSIYTNIDMVYCSNNAGLKIFYIVYPGGDPNQIVLHFDGATSTGLSASNLIVKSNWDQMKFVKPQMYQYTYVSSVITPVNICNASWQNVGTDRYGITTTSSWSNALPLIIEVSQSTQAQNSITGLKWSTYFGGSMQDYIYKARSDASNNLFVAGNTTSPNFPVNAGPMVVSTIIGSAPVSSQTSDGFVAKFDPAGVLQWVTYVGGSNAEQINDFNLKGGDMYCVGISTSVDLPFHKKSGAYNDTTYNGSGEDDGFIFQLGSNGQTNNWLSYFGGNKDDALNACMFDASGAFFIVGSSRSTNLTPVGFRGHVYTNLQHGATICRLRWYYYEI